MTPRINSRIHHDQLTRTIINWVQSEVQNINLPSLVNFFSSWLVHTLKILEAEPAEKWNLLSTIITVHPWVDEKVNTCALLVIYRVWIFLLVFTFGAKLRKQLWSYLHDCKPTNVLGGFAYVCTQWTFLILITWYNIIK